MAKTKWNVRVYYLDSCNCDWGCPCQFDALSEIATWRAGGGPFEVYMSVVDDLQEPSRAKISSQAKGRDSRIQIGNVAEAHLEPIRNPVTGKIHRAIIELPEGFEASRMDQSSTKKIAVDDDHLKFQYSGTYGSFQKTTWGSAAIADQNSIMGVANTLRKY